MPDFCKFQLPATSSMASLSADLEKKIDFADLAMHCLLTFGYMYFLLYFISFDLSVAKTLVHPCFRSKAPI